MNNFLKSFANTTQWENVKEILLTYRDTVTNVNDDSIVVEGATKGELFVGKEFAGKVLDAFIGDVDKYKTKVIPKKPKEDNFN